MDLRRCPMYLRMVNTSKPRGGAPGGGRAERRGWDGLDQREDEPHTFEDCLEVYRLKDGTFGQVFACARGKGAAASSGLWEAGDYEHVPIGDETRELLRTRPAFLTWAVLHHASAIGEGVITAEAGAVLAVEVSVFDFRRLAELVGGREVEPDLWTLRPATVPEP